MSLQRFTAAVIAIVWGQFYNTHYCANRTFAQKRYVVETSGMIDDTLRPVTSHLVYNDGRTPSIQIYRILSTLMNQYLS